MTTDIALDRRAFLSVSALAGGGLMLGISSPAQASEAVPAGLNAFVAIEPSGKVIIVAKNPEVGQGIKTSLPMLIAEELDCDWAMVEVAQGDFKPALYGRQSAGGSMSVPMHWIGHRQLGAAARAMLVQAAAARAGVAAAELTTAKGEVHHRASGRKWTYGALAADAAKLPAPALDAVTLKQPQDFALIGKAKVGVDSAKVLRGAPLFGIDTRLPGQLYAVLETAPAMGRQAEERGHGSGQGGNGRGGGDRTGRARRAGCPARRRRGGCDQHLVCRTGARVAEARLGSVRRQRPRQRRLWRRSRALAGGRPRQRYPPRRRSSRQAGVSCESGRGALFLSFRSRTCRWSRRTAPRCSRRARWSCGHPPSFPRQELTRSRSIWASRWPGRRSTSPAWAAVSGGG